MNYRNLAGLQTLFGQLWKEYALADSRYLTLDPFVLCMEAMTAVCIFFKLSRSLSETNGDDLGLVGTTLLLGCYPYRQRQSA